MGEKLNRLAVWIKLLGLSSVLRLRQHSIGLGHYGRRFLQVKRPNQKS